MRDLAVIIPTCAIPIHPSTSMIERVVASIRVHFPTEPIHLLCDGIAHHIREIPGRIENYEEYLLRCWRLVESGAWQNVHLHRFGPWSHQVQMTQKVLKEVREKFVFFVEHDTVIRDDRPINWDAIFGALEAGEAKLVRLSYWDAGVHPEHEHMSLGEFERGGSRFVRTSQFSGWPNVSTAEHYRWMCSLVPEPLPVHFETYLYGPCAARPDEFGVAVYCPEPPSQRFLHLDGRRIEEGKRDPACEL